MHKVARQQLSIWGADGATAACTLSRRYYRMQLLLHIPSWWGAKRHHSSTPPSPALITQEWDIIKSGRAGWLARRLTYRCHSTGASGETR